MPAFKNQSLMQTVADNWVPAVGTACLLAVAVATTSSISLYTAPSAVVSVPTSSVVSRPLMSTSRDAGVRSYATVEPLKAGEDAMHAQDSVSWAPFAAVTAIPLAIFGALKLLTSQKAQALDPIDVMTTTSTQWAMVATSGEAAVAKNYASALIELGQEGQCLEQLHSDMDNFGEILTDESFSNFFNNPLFGAEKQKDIIAKICEESNFAPVTKDFLCFVADKKRITSLPAIIKEFDSQFYEVTGTQVATVTAAQPLSEEQLRLIANKLHEITKGKNIKIKSQVDSDLLAGFVLEYGRSGSQRIDLSLRGQLGELEAELKEGIRTVLSAGVPAGVQLTIAAIGVNALLAGHALAGSGKIFDFGLTMPIQMIQFLLLMVFLEKTVFTPVGKILDERAAYIKNKTATGADNTKEIAALNAQAEELLAAARRDAAKELEKAKKEASAQGAERLSKAKAELDASLKRSLAEVEKSKTEIWAKLEEDVLPVLADDIVNKLMQEEPTAAAAKQ